MGYWWLLWLVYGVLFLVPISYGWGHRGWGPPLPSYVQRRRQEQAVAAGRSANHRSWGLGGDLVWALLLAALCWNVASFWWHRP